MKFFSVLSLLTLLLLPLIGKPACATPNSTTSPTQIVKLAAKFLQQQTSTLPGKISFTIDDLDQRLSFAACNHFDTFLPTGSQLIGKTTVGVRCLEPSHWSTLIPVQIKISRDLLISTQQLPIGHAIQPADIAKQTVEMTQIFGYTEPEQVLGKVLRYGIAAGQIFRDDMLRPPYVITQGQIVQITAQGNGFVVHNEGVALNNAGEGQTVQIRVANGRVISGTARNGGVDVAP